MADPSQDFRARTLAQIDPARALEGSRPRLVDEWQDVPKLWDAVRYECDQSRKKGQFILTGSSSPKLKKNKDQERPRHSGAGRIARISMGTMTQQELGQSTGDVSLASLFKGAESTAVSSLTLDRIAELVVAGGWPDARGKEAEDGALIAREYLKAVIEEDISEVDGVERDREKVRRLIASLARNESTLASNKTLQRDTADPSDPESVITKPTMNEYLEALRRLFFVQEIPAWAPDLRSSSKIRTSPKRHLADPSLAAAALGASAATLVEDLKTLGFLFESLVAHDLISYANACGASVYHYHDTFDLEADLVVEGADGLWIPVEVKLGASQEDEAAKNLLSLKAKMERAGYREPSAMLVVVGVGGIAHLREDGVQVATLDTLGV